MGPFEITIGVGLAILLALLGIGVGLAMTAADPNGFLVAKICFVFSALDIVGFAVYLLSRNTDNPFWRTVAAGAIGMVTIAALVWVLSWLNYREALTSTILTPGNQPTPIHPLVRGLPDNALLVLLGSNLAWATKMPHTVLMMGGEPIITIDRRRGSNQLVVTVLRIFDDRNNIIARIDEDGFWVENSTRRKRPNPGVLQIFDHTDAEVLRIEFLNPTTISVTGIFRHSGSATTVITPSKVSIGGGTMTGSVFGENAADIVVN
jgi:hypothetical protein